MDVETGNDVRYEIDVGEHHALCLTCCSRGVDQCCEVVGLGLVPLLVDFATGIAAYYFKAVDIEYQVK